MITGKCAILITHRLSAVQLADKVAVFDDGQVAEYGTHTSFTPRAASIRKCLISRRSSTATKSLNRNKIKNMSYLINHDGLNQFCWLPSLLCGRLNALRKGATVRITVRLLLRHLKNSSVLFVIHRKKCFDLTICIFCQKNGAVFFSFIFSASSAAIGKTSGTWSSQTAAAG